MRANAEQPATPTVSVRQGQSIRLESDGGAFEVTCDDIARLGLAMHKNESFFERRSGLKISLCRDINGSGVQALEIKRQGDGSRQYLMRVWFDVDYTNKLNVLYEADLIRDQRKDYEPSINHGKHGFVATNAEFQFDWSGGEAKKWRSDIARISKTPDTLASWVEADFDMLVICTGSVCFGGAVITNSELGRHVAAGVSLEELKSRLRCNICGERKAVIRVV